ncbi:MAG: potassium channel family protein [Anaerolineae bacterium]|nr:potassium channel family protein [Anaerolineae bacterium]
MLPLRLRIYLAIFAGVLVMGTVGFALTEGLTPLDALYFTIVTVGTVGYGDIHPSTPAGKALAILVIVMGVGTFLGVIGSVAESVIQRREKEERLEKLNMVIGAFFSEVGTLLLRGFANADPNLASVREACRVAPSWGAQDFAALRRLLESHPYKVAIGNVDLPWLKGLLVGKRTFLLGLLENPMLHEHETFTSLLWAVFHLADELSHREDLSALPPSDLAHLANDMEQAYALLAVQWLAYMEHLKAAYPYLFSLAVRLNPFIPNSSPVVQS